MNLLPCPFCATLDVEVERTKGEMWGGGGADLFEVCCSDCDIVGPVGDTADEAIRRWNKRGNKKQGRLWNEDNNSRQSRSQPKLR